MKLKNWVTITLIILTAFNIFLLLVSDNIAANILTLIATLINVILLTKYSKICDR